MAETKKSPAATKKAATKGKTVARKAPARTKKAATGATVTVAQIGSPIRRQGSQRATLIGLGLNKLHRHSTLPDNPSTRGMIEAVKHLVRVVDDAPRG